MFKRTHKRTHACLHHTITVGIFKQLEPKNADEYKGLSLRFIEKPKDGNAPFEDVWAAMKASKSGVCALFWPSL